MGRLALGTAQFGSDYGITNRAGQVGADEAGRILSLAREAGIDCIDTARLYGDSEEVIGGHHEIASDLRVITKTPTFGSIRDPADARATLTQAFEASLQALRRERIYGLLIHDARDLLGPLGPQLWSALEALKANGRVEKIGVSVYGGEAIDAVLSRYPIAIIQLPFNAFDRRLVAGGQLEALSRAEVEVHARSIFLQGLLLMPADNLPAKFAGLSPGLEKLDKLFAREGLNRLEGLLSVALGRSEISRLVVGVTSAEELQAIVLAAERAKLAAQINQADLRHVDPRFLDPSRWPELGRD